MRAWAMPAALALLIAAVASNICRTDKTGIAGQLFDGTRSDTWVITIILFLLMFASVGWGVRGRWDGILIDERNRVSLSRLQLAVWVIEIVSALFTAGLTNVFNPINEKGALAIHIPGPVWAMLGIGSFTAVAAPALLAPRGSIARILPGHGILAEASWLDLVRSDTDLNLVDVTKMQQLAFTALLICVYGLALWSKLQGNAAIDTFPDADPGFLALLGISHAAYLAGKPGIGGGFAARGRD